MIIETNSKEEYVGFEEFKNDYVNSRLTKRELMDKHNLGDVKYNRWRKHAISETGFSRKCWGKPKKTEEDLREILPMVADDYIDDVKIMDIREKYDLSQKGWRDMKKLILDEFDYERPKKKGVFPKTISLDANGYFRVQKYVNGKSESFGAFSKKSTAIKISRAMEKTGWDKSQYWRVRAEVLGV